MLFTDDTSIIVTNYNQGGLQTALHKTFSDIIAWFKASFILFNSSEMYYLEFRTKNCIHTTLDINDFMNTTANVPYTNFLGLVIDDTLTWDNHIYQINFQIELCMLYNNSSKSNVVKKSFKNAILFLSIISYCIIFLGNLPNSIKIFRMQ